MFLKQDWNKISIISSFITSESCSKTASLYSDSNEGIVLTFTYAQGTVPCVDRKRCTGDGVQCPDNPDVGTQGTVPCVDRKEQE